MHHRVLIEFVVDVPNESVARDVLTRVGREHQARLVETLASVMGYVPLQAPERPGLGVAQEPVTWNEAAKDWVGEDDEDDDDDDKDDD
jgi:hypothetical protein